METNDPMRATLALMGEAAATKQLLAVLIATHPDRDTLAATWRGNEPGWLEELGTIGLFQYEDFRRGALSAVAWISGVIDGPLEDGQSARGTH
jgi:hypothetical protein